jgi:hypothetical protein
MFPGRFIPGAGHGNQGWMAQAGGRVPSPMTWPPSTAPPVLVGATGMRSLRLSGEIADGSVLDARYRPQDVRRIRALIDEGRAEAGRTDPHETVVYLLAAISTDGFARFIAEEIRPLVR